MRSPRWLKTRDTWVCLLRKVKVPSPFWVRVASTREGAVYPEPTLRKETVLPPSHLLPRRALVEIWTGPRVPAPRVEDLRRVLIGGRGAPDGDLDRRDDS